MAFNGLPLRLINRRACSALLNDYVHHRSTGGLRSYCNTVANPLLKQLTDQINISGPLTIHQYMKTVLTHPKSGYYTKEKDVLGSSGDFITSPEISQMFGELIGVWLYSEWRKMGQACPLQLVEFGPGRGTLMKDVLRVLHKLGLSGSKLHIHLVEVSPFFREQQRHALCEDTSPSSDSSDTPPNTTFTQSPIFWHQELDSVPHGFTFFLAHEFFDALPVHRLVKTGEGWREVLVDLNRDTNKSVKMHRRTEQQQKDDDGSLPFRFVISRTGTPASVLYTQDVGERSELEVSPEARLLLRDVSVRVKERGGAMLVIDYGHEGTKADTFRAYRSHRQLHPLSEPGKSDLTADVDFSLLTKGLSDAVITYGPISQAFFLKNMGVELRLMRLLQNCKDVALQKTLLSGYKRIVEDLGQSFKVLAMYPASMKEILVKFPPPGFHRVLDDGWKDDNSELAKSMKRKLGVVDDTNIKES